MKRLLALIAALCISSGAFAEDIKISNLPAGGPIQDADKFPIARAGANYSILGSAFCRTAGCTMTAPILGPSGATPTYSFSGDPDTGVTNPSANQLGFVAGNVATAYVDATSLSLNPTFKLSFLGTGGNRIDLVPATPTGVKQMLVPDFNGYFAVFTFGTIPPDPLTCNEPNETTTFYMQTGSASANNQMFRCQTGVLPGWQPIGHIAKPVAPTACLTGNIWFDTDAVAGQNLYGCTSTDTWTLLSGTGGGSSSITSGTAAPIAGNCDAALEVGAVYIQSGDPDTVNLQSFRCTQVGASAYGWKPLGYNSGTQVTPACSVGNLFFDTDAIAGSNLYVCTAPDTWTAIAGIASPGQGILVDTAGDGSLVARSIAAGLGVIVTDPFGLAGDPTVSVDSSVVVRKGFGIADPPSCGDTGDAFQLGDFYFETDTNEISTCTAIDTWLCLNCASLDPGTTLEYVEECFLGNNTSGAMGAGGISSGALSGGTATLAASSAAYPAHPGLCQIQTGTTDNGGARFGLFNAFNGSAWGNSWASESWSMDSILRYSDPIESALYYGVVNNNTPSAASAAIGLMRDTDAGHTVFVFRVCDSATNGCQSAGDDTNQDSQVSTVTPIPGDWFRVRIAFDAVVQKLSCRIDNETPITFCASGCTSTIANLPTVAMSPMLVGLTRSTTTKNIDLDYWKIRMEFVSPRY